MTSSLLVLIVILIVLVIALVMWLGRRRRPEVRPRGPERGRERHAVVAPADRAREGAVKGIQQYKLVEKWPEWAARLQPPVGPLEPLLVERLEAAVGQSTYYYLVPFGESENSVTAVAMVDGHSTEFKEIVPMRVKSAGSWGHMAAASRTSSAGARASTAGQAQFVWKPCAESRSPYQPFRRATIEGKSKYVRLDGKIFDRLTPLGPGGRVYDGAGHSDKSAGD